MANTSRLWSLCGITLTRIAAAFITRTDNQHQRKAFPPTTSPREYLCDLYRLSPHRVPKKWIKTSGPGGAVQLEWTVNGGTAYAPIKPGLCFVFHVRGAVRRGRDSDLQDRWHKDEFRWEDVDVAALALSFIGLRPGCFMWHNTGTGAYGFTFYLWDQSWKD